MGATPVIVLGASGMLGSCLLRALARRGIVALAPTRAQLDLAAMGDPAGALAAEAADAVINASAFTDVAAAELPERRDEVFALNREAPARLAHACAVLGRRFVHVSTDYVFDGRKRTPYVEADAPAPLQVYGRSKLEGELAVRAALPEALIVRTSTLYGPGRRGRPHYVDAILDQARRGATIRVVRLPVSSPTYAPDLAEALLDLLGAGATGLVHASNAGACSRLELARETVRLAGLARRITVEERRAGAGGLARPDYSVLDGTRFAELAGRPLRPWAEALAEYVATRR